MNRDNLVVIEAQVAEALTRAGKGTTEHIVAVTAFLQGETTPLFRRSFVVKRGKIELQFTRKDTRE